MVKGGTASPLLKVFNIDPTALKATLKTMVNASFGMISMIMFLFFVFSGFRRIIVKPEDLEAKKKADKGLFLSGISLFVSLLLWLGIFQFVQASVIDSQYEAAGIEMTPANLADKTTPIEITFSADKIAKELVSRGYTPIELQWDFNGDGMADVKDRNKTTITYLFSQPGSTTVILSVVLDKGEPVKYTLPIDLPRGVFDVSADRGEIPFTVHFDALQVSRGVDVASYSWDFDHDGTFDLTTSKPTAEYSFDKIGSYDVTLRIVDTNNTVQVLHRTITVTAPTQGLTPTIRAVPSLSGAAPLRIQFDATDSMISGATIESYDWDFGDGTPPVSGRSANHIFLNPGSYDVLLKVQDSKKRMAQATATVTVQKQTSTPTAVITSTPAMENGLISGVPPLTVQFDGGLSTAPNKNIVDYEWDLNGDGKYEQKGQKVSFTFETVSENAIALRVTDAEGNVDTASGTVKVENRPLQAAIVAKPESGPVPLTVQFDASSSIYNKGKIVSYEWDFGDNTPVQLAGAQKSHRYTKVGVYTVKMKIYTDDNKTDTITKTIYARVQSIQACFKPSRTEGTAPTTVTFDSTCGSGQISQWTWDFGDGFTSTARTPTHTFEKAGTFTVHLQVSDENNNVGEYSDVITVK